MDNRKIKLWGSILDEISSKNREIEKLQTGYYKAFVWMSILIFIWLVLYFKDSIPYFFGIMLARPISGFIFILFMTLGPFFFLYNGITQFIKMKNITSSLKNYVTGSTDILREFLQENFDRYDPNIFIEQQVFTNFKELQTIQEKQSTWNKKERPTLHEWKKNNPDKTTNDYYAEYGF